MVLVDDGEWCWLMMVSGGWKVVGSWVGSVCWVDQLVVFEGRTGGRIIF